jgi:uncharacterized paraquat-inducible protein A
MNTVAPLPIIIHTNNEPERCPQCKHEEDIKRVCRNCGHEYKAEDDEKIRWKEVIVIWAVLLGGLWLLITVTGWLVGYKQSLVEILKCQWQWLTSLRIW